MAETVVAPNNRAVVYRGRPQRERAMPWTGKSFAERHNKKLSGGAAKSAARQATAMVNSGVDEGIAIATANKRANKLMKRPHAGTIDRLKKRGSIGGSSRAVRNLESRYGGKDQEPIDASTR